MYNINWSKVGIFVGGLVVGTAGLKVLTSKDAKKVYTHSTAAALRVKDCVMTGVTKVREGADDILAEARDINEERIAKEEVYVEDTAATEL
ncbi:MAG: DUF6110 family protein [Anaerotignaceae bacterium]